MNDSRWLRIGTALTEAGNDQNAIGAVMQRFGVSPEQLQNLETLIRADMADAFATVFVVATVLVACCLVPAFFLPRRKVQVDTNPEHGVALTH